MVLGQHLAETTTLNARLNLLKLPSLKCNQKAICALSVLKINPFLNTLKLICLFVYLFIVVFLFVGSMLGTQPPVHTLKLVEISISKNVCKDN